METIDSQNILTSENQEILFLSHSEINQEELLNKKTVGYEKFIKEIRTNLSKCKYRRALDEIERKEDLYYEIENSWKIKELKVITILKILNKKIYKSESPKHLKLKSIETWLRKIDVIIDNWIKSLIATSSINNEEIDNNNENIIFVNNNNHNNQNNNKYNICKNNNFQKEDEKLEEMETVLNLILQEFLFIAKNKKQENQIVDCSAILALSESLINSYYDYTLSPKFINTTQEIYLFTSSLLISDNDFQSAKAYQALTIKAAFKELFFRIDVEEGLNPNSIKNPIKHKLNKIFVNIVLAFYQRGVSEENLGKMANAIEAYKQAVWFSRNFIKYQYPEISQLLSDIELRAVSFHLIIVNKLQEKNYELIHKAVESKDNQGKHSNSNIKQDLFSKNKDNYLKEKEKEIVDFLNELNFQEFEFAEDKIKSNKVKNILGTLTLLNNFSSEQFKDLLKNDIEVSQINNIDEATVEKIQKRLNQIKTDKLFQKREMENKRENFKVLFVNSQLMKESIVKVFSASNAYSDRSLYGYIGGVNKACNMQCENNFNSDNNKGKTRIRHNLTGQNNEKLSSFSERKGKQEEPKVLRQNKRINSLDNLNAKKNENVNLNNLKANNLNSTFAQTKVFIKDSQSLLDNFNKNPININPNLSPLTQKLKSYKKDDFNNNINDKLSKSPISFRNMNNVENLLNEKNKSPIKHLDNSTEDFIKDEYLDKISQKDKVSKPKNHFRTKSGGSSQSNFNFLSNQKEKVTKYNHDKYTLSKAFQQKLKKLANFTKRETEFQKKILKLKRFEKLPAEAEKINNNTNIIKSQTAKAFERLIVQNKSLSPIGFNDNANKKNNDKILKDDKKFHNDRLKNRLEVSLIKSLDVKVLKNWDAFMKNSEKTEQKVLREEFIRKNRETVLMSVDKTEVIRKLNEEQLKKIEKDLDVITKEEIIFKRMLKPESNFHLKQNILKGKIKNFGSNIKVSNLNLSRNGPNVESFVRIFGKRTNNYDSKTDVVNISKK